VKKIVLAAVCCLIRTSLVGAYAFSPQVRAFVRVDAPAVRRTHIRVIDGTGSAVPQDQTMVRADGKIVSIADRASANIAKDARVQVMDLHESRVISGLVGTHHHLSCPVFNRAIGGDSAEAMGSARGAVGSR
jgi:cytosine/adenosine deaminase-related metal-dependent hydrolase